MKHLDFGHFLFIPCISSPKRTFSEKFSFPFMTRVRTSRIPTYFRHAALALAPRMAKYLKFESFVQKSCVRFLSFSQDSIIIAIWSTDRMNKFWIDDNDNRAGRNHAISHTGDMLHAWELDNRLYVKILILSFCPHCFKFF